ncbi:MAG: F510_1955 family glycosylhydrolase [Candidatus Kariarchaeaceae archaeon]
MYSSEAHEPDSEKSKASLDDNVFLSNEVFFSHIHGIGYNSDGNRILVVSHAGIKLYTNGKWEAPDLPAHDYMGFAPVDDEFYSSGHPAHNTDLLNPLGLVKVSDDGEDFTSLVFAGVIDFHLMAAGHYSHTIYVITEESHPQLESGLNYSPDDGKTWTHINMNRQIIGASRIAVHPTDVRSVAVATKKGLYLSNDFGNRFDRLADEKTVTAINCKRLNLI